MKSETTGSELGVDILPSRPNIEKQLQVPLPTEIVRVEVDLCPSVTLPRFNGPTYQPFRLGLALEIRIIVRLDRRLPP